MGEKKNGAVVFQLCKSIAAEINASIEKEKEKDGAFKPDKKLLDSLTDNFLYIVDFLKQYLIMGNDILYGSILIQMQVNIDFNLRGFVDIQIDKSGLQFVMRFNPLFLDGLTFPNVLALTVAEILRLIYEHPTTFAEKNEQKDEESHRKLETASDASIEGMISNQIQLDVRQSNVMRVPDDFADYTDITKETDKPAKDLESIDYYFEFLNHFSKKPPPEPSSGGGKSSNGAPASPKNSGGDQKHDWESCDSDKVSDRTKSLVMDALDGIPSDKRGLIPSGIREQIRKMLEPPEINWKQTLRKFVGTIPFPYRKTKKRLNRRQPERGDLSGRLPKRKVDIVVCIDTSGSMSNKVLSYCMTEIFNISKEHDARITIIECDAEVGRVYTAKKPSDISPELTGRGGTSFIPAIDYINKEGKYQKALMIYFTDGFGDSEVPKPRTFRNMWVVIGDEKNLSVKEPYGEVKSLLKDKDWQRL